MKRKDVIAVLTGLLVLSSVGLARTVAMPEFYLTQGIAGECGEAVT